ncbi:glycine betaine ABC transporter substrate-binding protein [Desulfoscipio sp. XC116]|uniref:glycine betaine ABC transporter substrate-binding protein n=1 Tax=Desulfoscipio sp. XC116 TaxID=3144975 RepID=UPI00325ADAC6
MRKSFKLLPLAAALVLLTAVLFGCGGGGGGGTQGKIVGIEPGAGIMSATEKAVEEYGLDYQLQDSSSAAMAASLQKAINNKEWIVVTGWTPHWKFAKWDLKYLDDPKKVYGGEEHVATIVRTGLKDDMPEVYAMLDNFYWTPADMEAVMLDIQDGMTPDEAADQWIRDNQEEVNKWIPEQQAAEKGTVTLGYVEWDSEVASTHVVKNVLEDMGYEVNAVSVDAGIMWTSIGTGEYDAIVSAWLPGTHGDYYNKVKDKVVNLGPNLEGARIGLVVPAYVTIDSIEELNDVKDKFQ